MIEPVVVLLRLAQYGGAMILLGSSLFSLYAMPRGSVPPMQAVWLRWLLTYSAVAVFLGSVLGLIAQTVVMAGSLEAGFTPDAIYAVASQTGLGRASLVRAATSLVAIAGLIALPGGRPACLAAAIAGMVVVGSFPWTGHGAATEGVGGIVHLLSDIVHGWAAAVWIGALAAFFMLLRKAAVSVNDSGDLHAALHGFSGVGSAAVAVLIASGVVNSWFLAGPDGWRGLVTTPYGQLLILKLAMFGLMLGLAAANRFRLTPALGSALDEGLPTVGALERLRRTVIVETAAAFGVLAVVAWLGTLAPVSAQ